MGERPTLLYILAPSFSGSTLLTYLLAQHPDIATVGEFKATQMGPPEDYLCSCGEPILQCEFWKDMQNKADAGGIEFAVNEFGTVFDGNGRISDKVVRASVRGGLFELVRTISLKLLPGIVARLDRIAERNKKLAAIVGDIQGGHVFLDGSKDAVRLLHMINSERWNVKVIYLQRDGRGVSASFRKHEKLSHSDAIDEWKHSVTELQNMRDRLDAGDVFDLKYEDLCRDPATTMQRIWDWLQVDRLEIQESEFKSGDYHILGNAMRLNGMSEIRLDEKWRSSLLDEELRLFETRGGAFNRRLGYK